MMSEGEKPSKSMDASKAHLAKLAARREERAARRRHLDESMSADGAAGLSRIAALLLGIPPGRRWGILIETKDEPLEAMAGRLGLEILGLEILTPERKKEPVMPQQSEIPPAGAIVAFDYDLEYVLEGTVEPGKETYLFDEGVIHQGEQKHVTGFSCYRVCPETGALVPQAGARLRLYCSKSLVVDKTTGGDGSRGTTSSLAYKLVGMEQWEIGVSIAGLREPVKVRVHIHGPHSCAVDHKPYLGKVRALEDGTCVHEHGNASTGWRCPKCNA